MPYSPHGQTDDPLFSALTENDLSDAGFDLDSILSEFSSDPIAEGDVADPLIYARPWSEEDYGETPTHSPKGDFAADPGRESEQPAFSEAADPVSVSDVLPESAKEDNLSLDSSAAELPAPPAAEAVFPEEEAASRPEEEAFVPASEADDAETAPAEADAVFSPPERSDGGSAAASPAPSGTDAAESAAYNEKKAPLPPEEKQRRRVARLRAFPFFLVLTQLTIVAWLLPLRPTYSALEKRDLQPFPEFSVETLFSGDWFDGISLWFSDTFPGRENWVNLQSRLTSRYGDRSIVFTGSLVSVEPPAAETPVTVTPVTVTPAEETPAPQQEILPPAAPTEETPAEETPAPEADLGEGLIFDPNEARRISSALYSGDAAYEFYGANQDAADRYCEILSNAAKKYDGQCRIFSVICPNSGGIVLDYQTYDEFYNIRQGDAIERFYQNKHDNLYPVYVYDTLRSHNDEYLYFRTDHHWTGLAAYYAYEQWCAVAGVEPVPLSEYTELQFPGFLGSYYQHNINDAMADNPDTVVAYQPGEGIHARYHEMGGGWIDIPCVVDKSDATYERKYLSFLNGDHYETEIINDNIQDDSSCLVIKDSYGNNFSIYLAQHYHTVVIRDWHYENRVSPIVKKYGIDDIFIVTELVQAQSSDMLNLLYGDLTH